jgi:hypothetical protein
MVVPLLMMATSRSSSESQKIFAVFFPTKGTALNFFFLGELHDAIPLIVSFSWVQNGTAMFRLLS